MMRYYGFYRTRAAARVIVEAGAAGADDPFLARTDLIAAAVSRGYSMTCAPGGCWALSALSARTPARCRRAPPIRASRSPPAWPARRSRGRR